MPAAEAFLELADLLPDALLLVGGDGEVRAANEAAGQLLGIGADDLAGRSLAGLAASERDELAAYLRSCARSRRLLPGAMTLTASDGRQIELRSDGASYRRRHGRSEALVVLRLRLRERSVTQFTLLNERIAELGREIRRRRRAEEALEDALARERQARARAEAADRAKDEFLATLSHELRAPLQAITSWTFLLKGRQLDAANVTRALEIIERNLELQASLVDDLLDISHIIAGQIHLDRRPVDLGALVHAVCEELRQKIESKGVRLEVAVDPRGGRVTGDVARLRQVMTSLLSNALKFTPENGAIEVRLEPAAGGTRILVSDTGEGIDAANLGHIFESFGQADGSRTRSHGGLGLGLTIARHLIELHGGTLEAASPGKGRGTTFTVTLPGEGSVTGTTRPGSPSTSRDGPA